MTHVLLVGCGKMGGALLAGWQKSQNAPMRFSIIARSKPSGTHASAHYYSQLSEFPADETVDIIVFAVKPQQLSAILPEYRARFEKASALYISIAAGKTIAYFKQHLGDNARIIRVMPNTPSLIGQGVSLLFSPGEIDATQKESACSLMQAVGSVAIMESEQQLDAATAISGCGPAYVFLFLESLTKAGIMSGLSEPVARELALGTVYGSAALALDSDESFAKLRQNVTSPGGVTEAALRVLMQEKGLDTLLKEAVLAAQHRAKEL